MFAPAKSKSRIALAFSLAERTYHATVRAARSKHRNAIVALLIEMLQAFVFILVFLGLVHILGRSGGQIRGDTLLYVMSGIFMFRSHNKSIAAVSGAADSVGGMMQHAPMNTVITILSAALSTLYLQVLSAITILTIYHLAINRITIDQPVAVMGMMILAWAYGSSVGLVFAALKPWFPRAVMIAKTFFMRANMIASGKMFVANSLNFMMLKMFDWNPLFHIIDQTRGYVFLNYSPRYPSVEYPVRVMIIVIVIGLMLEFKTRQHASRSWKAR